jgi:hypothetical protein
VRPSAVRSERSRVVPLGFTAALIGAVAEAGPAGRVPEVVPEVEVARLPRRPEQASAGRATTTRPSTRARDLGSGMG